MGGNIINCIAVIAARLYVATSDRAISVYDVGNMWDMNQKDGKMTQVCQLEGHDAYGRWEMSTKEVGMNVALTLCVFSLLSFLT